MLREALEGREEGRHRPARDARPGICRRLKPCGRGMVLETLRYADEVNKAIRLFPRHRRRQARPRPARPGGDADRARRRGEFDAERVPQPLRRRAEGADRGEAARRRARRSSRTRTPTRRRPRARNVIDLMAALKKSLGDDKRRQDGREEGRGQAGAARRRPRRPPAKRAAGAQAGVSHGRRASSTSRPTTRSATSRRRRSPRAASSRARATASSSRSMTRRGCTGISGSSSTGC